MFIGDYIRAYILPVSDKFVSIRWFLLKSNRNLNYSDIRVTTLCYVYVCSVLCVRVADNSCMSGRWLVWLRRAYMCTWTLSSLHTTQSPGKLKLASIKIELPIKQSGAFNKTFYNSSYAAYNQGVISIEFSSLC